MPFAPAGTSGAGTATDHRAEAVRTTRHVPPTRSSGNNLLTCEADKRGRLGHADTPYPQDDYLREAFASARAITAHAFVERGLEDPAIAEAQRQERIKAIGALRD